MALCSLSTGIISTPFFAASAVIILPAVTRASLLASAICFLASMAFIVGKSAAVPLMAITAISALLHCAAFCMPSSPSYILRRVFLAPRSFLNCLALFVSLTATNPGLNLLICSRSSPILESAASASTLNLAGNCEIMRRAFVPIEPVEPNKVIFFTMQKPEGKSRIWGR